MASKLKTMGAAALMVSAMASWAGGDTAVDEAIADLAARLQIPVEQISVLSQTDMTWPDKSLGCPRKGMSYAQVLTDGSQLVLAVAEARHYYHSGAGKPYFYCAVPAKKSGAPIEAPPHDS